MNARRLFFLPLILLFATATVGVLAQETPRSDTRIALVIGNAAYSVPEARLLSPTKDAEAIASELRRLGFSDIELGTDLTKEGMRQAIGRFTSKIKPGSVPLVFFSGHAIQVDGRNYLIPVDAELRNEDDVRRDSVRVESLLAEMRARGARAQIAILDASRTNPFAKTLRLEAGVAPITAPDQTLAISSAAPGTVADDGDGSHSVLVSQLIKEMQNPGLSMEEIFARTRFGVSRASGGKQVPWISSSSWAGLVPDFSQTAPRSKLSADLRPEPRPERNDRPELTDLFPWPPPTPSTRRSFSPDVLANSPAAKTAGEVAARLEELLSKAEFDTWGFFRTPGGFALVTRTERLDAATGKPLAGHQRWSDQIAPAGITLSTIFGWSRPKGVYRVLVFILTDDPPMSRQLGAAETLELTRRWPLMGRAALPAAVRADVVGQSHQLVALIYEFEKGQGTTTTHNVPSRWSLDHHLRTVGISLKPLR